MENIYNLVGQTSRKHYHKIKKIVEHLTLFCGIDCFWRNAHHINGSYSLIGNNPTTAEVFFEQGLFKGHPYFRHPKFFRSGFVIPAFCKSLEYEDTQGKFKDCNQILLYIHKMEHGFIEYGFATSKPISNLEVTYLNHLPTFRKFIDYFEVEGKAIIEDSSKFDIDIAKIIGNQYLISPEITGDTIVPKDELHFLTAIETNSELAKSIPSLTKSEKIYLGHYLTGGTVKQTAQKLHISPRTLEKHLENVKGKLGVATRSELFDCLNPYQDLLIKGA